MQKQIGIILLAAGSSSRMGVPKQLLDFHGIPLLRHVAEVARAAACGPVVVVLGSREQEMRSVLSDLDVEIEVNERWAEGMGTSIQTGVKKLADRQIDGVILALADQPFVTPELLRRLVIRHDETGKGTGSVYAFAEVQ